MKKLLVFLFFLFLSLGASIAQIIHVPGDYPTIQEGIAAAYPGDTVLVADGNYPEQINFLGKKPLIVASQFLMDGDPSHIDNTVIDGSLITNMDAGSIVNFISGEDTTSILCGFTVTNGTKGTKYTADGYLIWSGGAVYLSYSGGKIIWNNITGNTLNSSNGGTEIVTGAGIGNQWTLDDMSWIVIENNTITGNSCLSNAYQAGGAGICLGSNARVAHNTISNNQVNGTSSAQAFGGGMFLGHKVEMLAMRTVYVTDNLISNNSIQSLQLTSPAGGGCSFQAIKTIFTGNIVENNVISSANQLASGGGVKVDGPRSGTIFKNNTFRNNLAEGNGGGLSVKYFSQYHSDTVRIYDNYFLDNSANNGGGIHIDANLALVKNNVFSGNHGVTWGGGAFVIHYVTGAVQPIAFFANNTFSMNSAGTAGGAVFSFKAKPIVLNSIFWNDSSDVANGPEIAVSTTADVLFGLNGSGDTLEIAYCDFDPLLTRGPRILGGVNFNQDPGFLSPDSLNISYPGPCVDSGTDRFLSTDGITVKATSYDILGLQRPIGVGYDVGAYEVDYVSGTGQLSSNELQVWNYPNPFTGQTTISLVLPEAGYVSVRVTDLLGKPVYAPAGAVWQAGRQSITWDSKDLPGGIYFLTVEYQDRVITGKMVKR